MRGNPKHLNSKADYIYLKDNYPESVWKPVFQTLYDDRVQLFNRGVLAEGETGITNATHKVVESQNMEGETIRYQYEQAVNPDAWVYRIGFTDEEILSILVEG